MIDWFETKLGVNFIQAWGMTETSPLGTVTRLKPKMKDLPREKQLDVKQRAGIYAPGLKLRIVDDEFDRAVTDMIAGRRGNQLPWRVHLDQVSVGSMPSSAAPFVLTTSAGGTRAYNVMTVVPKPTN